MYFNENRQGFDMSEKSCMLSCIILLFQKCVPYIMSSEEMQKSHSFMILLCAEYSIVLTNKY